MNEAQHTPGPWEWWDRYDFREYANNQDSDSENFQAGRIKLCHGGQNGKVVLEHWADLDGDGGLEISKPDARLIAAAPDMLEALKLVATGKPETGLEAYMLAKVSAAIAKAEGGSHE